MSKRLVFVGSMLAVSTLNLAATLPVLAQADLQNRVVKTEGFERPSDAIINNSAPQVAALQKQEDAIAKEHEPVDSSKTTIQEFLEPDKVLDSINKGTDPASEFAPDPNTQEKQVKTDAQSTPSNAQSAPPVDEAAAANKTFLRT